MAKKMYIGANNVARKVKKQYIGVDGKARKVKKGYIGVGGVARPFFSGGQLVYYGALSTQPNICTNAAATVGDYAVYAGGSTGNQQIARQTNAYDKNLVHSSPLSLSSAMTDLSAASTKDYMFLVGGTTSTITGSQSGTTTVVSITSFATAITASLTQTTVSTLATKRAYAGGVALNEKFAFFGGGTTDTAFQNPTNALDVYDNNLVRTKLDSLGYITYNPATASNGKYAFFAGGHLKTTVMAFDENFVRTSVAALPRQTQSTAGVSFGKYAMFGGGNAGSSTQCPYVSIIDENLVKTDTTHTTLNGPCWGVRVEDFAVFCKRSGVDTLYYDMDLVSGLGPVIEESASYTTASVGSFGILADGATAYALQCI